jgi:hypothetical protein
MAQSRGFPLFCAYRPHNLCLPRALFCAYQGWSGLALGNGVILHGLRSLPHCWAIALSGNGWTTNELGFEWLEHFDKHSKDRTIGVYRLLTLDGHESQGSFKI